MGVLARRSAFTQCSRRRRLSPWNITARPGRGTRPQSTVDQPCVRRTQPPALRFPWRRVREGKHFQRPAGLLGSLENGYKTLVRCPLVTRSRSGSIRIPQCLLCRPIGHFAGWRAAHPRGAARPISVSRDDPPRRLVGDYQAAPLQIFFIPPDTSAQCCFRRQPIS
jgi:hypothetical protein